MTVNRKSILFVVLCWLACTVSSRLAAQQANNSEVAPFKIEVKVNRVLVPVVVRDAQHHVVGNLRKEDFQVVDKDKPKVISRFTVEQRSVEDSDEESGNLAPADPNAALKTLPAFGGWAGLTPLANGPSS